jgi:hypothetical protein
MMATRMNRMMSISFPHSVRDAYTKRQLIVAGVPEANIFNTSCPSLWDLPPVRRLASLDTLIVTLTDYNRSPAADQRFLWEAVQRFTRVLLWPQGTRDDEYARSLAVPGVGRIARTVDALRCELRNPNAAYAGTRLHAGALALQCGAPTLILAVDNRATEIRRDTGLPTIRREDFRALVSWLASPTSSEIRLPAEKDLWLEAFENSLTVQRVG